MFKIFIKIVLILLPILIISFFILKNNSHYIGIDNNKILQKIPLQHQKPVNKDASLGVVKTLDYFYRITNDKDTKIVVGQNIGSASDDLVNLNRGYEKYFNDLKKETGKLPVILGIDYGWEKQLDNYTNINKILIDHWENGGLVEISMSPGNPFTGGGLRDFSTGGYTYDDIITEGTVPNARWNKVLDAISVGLLDLQSHGVIVLWRPLHEMNGDFFWWSYGNQGRATKEEYIKLWKYTYEYLTINKKINNLIWIYSPAASMWENGVKDTDFYYPGNNYVDMVGMDYYSDDISQINNHGNYDKLIATGKPFGFSEFGPESRNGFDNSVVIKELQNKYPNTSYILYWSGWNNIGFIHTNRAIIENSSSKEFMNSDSVITLDEFLN